MKFTDLFVRRPVLALVVSALTPLHNHAWWKQSRMAPLLDGSLRMMAPLLPASLKQWLPPALHGS